MKWCNIHWAMALLGWLVSVDAPWPATAAQVSPVPYNTERIVTILRPSEQDGTTEELRVSLNVKLQGLAKQIAARTEVLAKLRGAYDGSVKMAMKVNYLNMLLLQDQAEMLATIAPLVTELRWAITVDRHRQNERAKQLDSERVDLQSHLERGIEAMLDLEEQKKQSSNARERQTADNRMATVREELEELAAHLDEKGSAAREARDKVQGYDEESRDLRELRRHLDADARLTQLRVGRLADAIDEGRSRLIAMDVEEKRQPIRGGWSLRPRVTEDPNTQPVYAAEARRIEEAGIGLGATLRHGDAVAPTMSSRLADAIEKARAKRARGGSR